MAKHLGDFDAGTVIYGKFSTSRPSTGASFTLGGTPALSVYKDNSTTESTSGVTLTVDFDSRTGMHHYAIDTSADGTFYAAGSNFDVVITTGTVDSVSVVGQVVASFTIRKKGQVTVATNNDKTAPTAESFRLLRYGKAGEVYVAIGKAKTSDFALSADWTPAAGDVKVSKDGGAAANIGTLPTAITMGNTAYWKFVFTAAELTAAKIAVTVGDAATKAVQDHIVNIITYGHPSSGLAFLGALQIGTVQAATTDGITLETTPTLDATGMPVVVSGSAGIENRLGTTYNSGTHAITMNTPWANTPAVPSDYALYPAGFAVEEDPATGDDANTIEAGQAQIIDILTNTGAALSSAYDIMKGNIAMTESYAADGQPLTLIQALYMAVQRMTDGSISNTTLTVRKRDGSTPAFTIALNNSSSPTDQTQS